MFKLSINWPVAVTLSISIGNLRGKNIFGYSLLPPLLSSGTLNILRLQGRASKAELSFLPFSNLWCDASYTWPQVLHAHQITVFMLLSESAVNWMGIKFYFIFWLQFVISDAHSTSLLRCCVKCCFMNLLWIKLINSFTFISWCQWQQHGCSQWHWERRVLGSAESEEAVTYFKGQAEDVN